MKDSGCFNEGLIDFHLVMDTDRLSKLDHFMGLFTIKRRSAFIRFLLLHFSLFLEQAHFLNEELMGEYRLINPEKDVKRKNIHLFIPEGLHRRIKLIHQDLNSFSMAQVVRIMIDGFLVLAEELGEGICDYLKKMQTEWNRVKEAHKKNKKPIRTIHMLKNQKNKDQKNHKIALKIHYSSNFSPTEIYLL